MVACIFYTSTAPHDDELLRMSNPNAGHMLLVEFNGGEACGFDDRGPYRLIADTGAEADAMLDRFPCKVHQMRAFLVLKDANRVRAIHPYAYCVDGFIRPCDPMLFAYDLDGMAPKRRILEALYSAKKDHTVSTLARQAFSKSQFHMDDEKRKQAQRFAGGAFKEMRERPELDFGMMRPPFLRRSEMLRGDPTRGEQEMCASYEVDPLLKEYHAEAKLGKGRDVVYGDGWQSFAKLEADFFAPPAPNLLAVPVEIEFDDGSSITIKVTADESLEDILRKIAEAIIGSP